MIENNDIDPLLRCLVLYTELYHIPHSAESLIAGLPIQNGQKSPELFSPESSKGLFSRAARKAGLSSRIVKKDLQEISPLVLPAILVLSGKSACILEAFSKDKKQAKIILPEAGGGESWVSIEELEGEYLGYAFYLKKEYKVEALEKKSDEHTTGHWFWGTMWMSRYIYRDVILASLIINIALVASPLFTMNVYDRVIPNDALETMWVLASGIMLVYVLDMIMKFTRSYYLEIAAKKSDVIISSILFEKVLDIRMKAKPKSVGSFANNLREFDAVRSFISSGTLVALIDLPFLIIFLFVVWMLGGWIVAIPTILGAMILLYTLAIKNPLQQSIKLTQKAASNKNSVLVESLMNLETIKTMGANGQSQWNWEEANGYIADVGLKSKLLSASIPTVTNFLIQMTTVLMIIAGVYMIQEKTLTMGALIAAVMLSSRAMSPLGQVASMISNYENVKSSYASLSEIMQLPSEHPNDKEFLKRVNLNGDIEFKNVTFKYPDEDKYTLQNVSFKIRQGERVGIVGRIGSGKTTVEKLMMGLYEIDEGSIMVDGIDIYQIDPVDLRKNISYVPQDISLMKGTVRENIIFREPSADERMIFKAARISGAEEFINRHPRGFDMNVGERGEGISGGQRQSIAIARAIVADAPIMIFDEPTSMMDSISEEKIKKNLTEIFENKTIIVVTHKTSLLDLVDRLLVFENGKIIADGPKKEIMEKLSKGRS
ncbi:MAG: type I secretion system permease/ATPase [Sulfurimonas sp.]|uniref:type I secretion system permease/ATPase n=1 Tax=Sulfurimonas sp. TaxID=2022749 RepID=UPI00262A64D9|nr:type I secretion system permease/ATPase [Sulfurimonas sp.]MDD2651507.1 type I secretion system permease/ATPase [Sulfurimonas sp.]MDD3451048.1 type I secretion system permease/ATPase [Sulfurimonas sp.]